MTDTIHRFSGANMDIDLVTPQGEISWQQDSCPWNVVENSSFHRCAVKNISICEYFCGVEYLDTLLCSYPKSNPLKQE